MEFERKSYNKIKIIVFLLSFAFLGIIIISAISISISEERLVIKPRTFDDFFVAKKYYQRGEYSKAHKILLKEYTLSVDTKRQYDVALLYGKVLTDMKRYNEALDIFKSMTYSIYIDSEYYYSIADMYLKQLFYTDAIYYYEKSLEINSNYIPSLLALGAFYSDNSLKRLSKGYFERVVALDKNNDQALYSLGLIASDEGFNEVAYNILSELVKRGRSVYSDKAAVVLGDMYTSRGDTNSAIQMYLRSLKNNILQTESIERLVKIYENDEDNDGVKKVYEQVLSKDPKNQKALLALGGIYSKENNYKLAINYYNRLVKLQDDVNLREHIMLLANAYYEENMFKEASDNYKKIASSKVKDANYIVALSRLGDITYKQKQYNIALKYYQELYVTDDNNAIFIPRLGELELYYGNTARGISLLEEAVKRNIGKAFPSRTLAMYYENVGDNNNAIKYFLETLENYPSDRESVFRLGMLYYKIKDTTKASEYLLISATTKENNSLVLERAWANLASMAEENQDYINASIYYRELVSARTTVENIYLYADYQYRRLNYREALALYMRALEYNPNKKMFFNIYFSMAKTYHRLGNLKLSEEYYKKALEYEKGNMAAEDALKSLLSRNK